MYCYRYIDLPHTSAVHAAAEALRSCDNPFIWINVCEAVGEALLFFKMDALNVLIFKHTVYLNLLVMEW